jgi:hypothetical protein
MKCSTVLLINGHDPYAYLKAVLKRLPMKLPSCCRTGGNRRYSSMLMPDPPNSLGTSFNLGNPSKHHALGIGFISLRWRLSISPFVPITTTLL